MAFEGDNINGLTKLIIEAFTLISSGGFILFRIGQMTQKFELIGRQQAKEISELKENIEKLNEMLVQMANQNGRINVMEERQMMTIKRLDEISTRLNIHLDNKINQKI
jgi:hypothetical protein